MGLLAACQALLLTNSSTLIAVNSLAGLAIASDKRLATLPVTAYVLGSALSTLPASLAMRHIGRRAGFTLGAGLGIVGVLICAVGVAQTSLAILCSGTLLVGVYNAFGLYYRFAAVDVADQFAPGFRERAIALVLAGGIVGGVLGPETSKYTRTLFSTEFAGSYACLALFALVAMILVQQLQIAKPSVAERAQAQRPLLKIARQPAFIVAVMGAAISYGVMNLLMTATPLAMRVCRYPFASAAFVLEWHVIAMYAPGFFSGGLIRRFGVLPIMLAGVAAMMACVGFAISGVSISHFWLALVLLGIGWNFLYVGGTTLLTSTYQASEKAKVQGVNDALVFVAMMISSFSSGAMFSSDGWNKLNLVALPFLTLIAIALAALGLHQRRLAS